ncbi:MAG: MTH1187 family thiamine-binding protein [Pseudomonadota bacterium]
MLALVTISPLDKGESLSEFVAPIVGRIADSGLSYKLTALGTIIEGDADAVFDLIRDCHREMRKVSGRVVTHIAIDDREGVTDALTRKPAAVEANLGRTLDQ